MQIDNKTIILRLITLILGTNFILEFQYNCHYWILQRILFWKKGSSIRFRRANLL